MIFYARIKIHIKRVKSIKSSSTNRGLGYKTAGVIDKLSQHAVTQLQSRETTCYPNMLYTNKLSQHAISQSKAREARHTIPACSSLDKLSQHALGQLKAREARHTIPACSGSQSQLGKARHAIPAYTVQTCYPSMHCEK